MTWKQIGSILTTLWHAQYICNICENKVPLVAFDYTVQSFVERPRCEISTPIMIITVCICVEVTRQDWVASRKAMSHIWQSSGGLGTHTQGTEIVSQRSKSNLQQNTHFDERQHRRRTRLTLGLSAVK